MTELFEPLTPVAKAVLEQLFFNGPTWDGDIISKNGRGQLVRSGLAFHAQGWASLTELGMTLAVEIGLGHDKERRQAP